MNRSRWSRILAWWPLAVAVLAVAAVYGPPVLAGRFWAPGDGVIQSAPQRALAGWAMARGEFPFWNPYLFGGMPFFATAQVGMLSPLAWPGFALGMAAAANGMLALGFAVMLAGFVAFARTLGLPVLSGAVAGLIYALGGFVTWYSGNPAILHALAVLPWVLAALERHAVDGRARWLAGAGLGAAMMVLSGHPQTAAYALILAGAYALVRGGPLPAMACRVAALGLGVGIALVQLIPTLDLVAASQRKTITFAWLTIYSVPPLALPTHLFPFLFGSRDPSWLFPVPLWANVDWWGYLESYVGPAAWLLALTALGRWRERMVAFWAVVAATGLLLTLGRYTPLYQLWALLPFVKQMPYASRHAIELIFALAMLAAYAVDWLVREPQAARKALARAAGVLGAAMAAVWVGLLVYAPGFAARTQPFVDQAPGHPAGLVLASALAPTQAAFWVPPLVLLAAWLLARFRPGLVILVLALDLWSFNRHQGVAYILPHAPAGALAAAPRDLPIRPPGAWPAGRSLTLTVARYPDCKACDVFAYLRGLHYPDLTLAWGEPTVNGYDAFLPGRYGRLLGMDSFGHAGDYDPTIWDPPHRALDLVGLGTVRLEPEVAARPEWVERLAGGRWERLPGENGLVVVRNRTAMPHAWRVTAARVLAPDAVDAAVRGLAPFDAAREALLDGPVAGLPAALAPGPARAETTSLNRMRLVTDGPGPGLVVIGAGYDAGWKAWDAAGRELPVVRADGLLTGVVVPAGAQEVALAYAPPRWRLAVGASLASLLGLLALVGGLAYRRRRRPAAEP